MADNLYAPPTAEEIKLAKAQLYAPPSDAEIALATKQVMSAPRPQAKAEGADLGGMVNAAVRGGAQGASLGFADEATAGVGGLYQYAKAKLGLRGDITLPDAYHTMRDAIRRADVQAAEDHPAVYIGGEVAGGLGTAFAPGLGALNVGKGAGLIEAAGKGAIQGGLVGAGQAKEITDVPGEAYRGAKVGAVVGGGLNLLGRGAAAVAEKLKPANVGSVLLNAPESALERYIGNPEAVNAARPRAEIVQEEFLPRLEKLRSEVSGGSGTSRAILAAEGHEVPAAHIADLLDSKLQEIASRSEGVVDPAQVPTVKWLEDHAANFRAAGDKNISTNRVKDFIQAVDKTTEYNPGLGAFSKIDDLVKQDIRRQADTLLKGSSSAYAEQMRHVAEDTRILNDVADLAKSPQGFDNLLKRTQRGNAPHLLDALQRFDERTGGNLLNELQNSAAKDALAKGAMNGSRNVNLHGATGDAIGEAIGGIPGKIVGRVAGLTFGASVDKYGPQMARSIVDSSAKLQQLLDTSQGLQRLGAYAQPLITAATKGDQALAATHAYLFATDKTYREILSENQRRDAMKRRMHAPAE